MTEEGKRMSPFVFLDPEVRANEQRHCGIDVCGESIVPQLWTIIGSQVENAAEQEYMLLERRSETLPLTSPLASILLRSWLWPVC